MLMFLLKRMRAGSKTTVLAVFCLCIGNSGLHRKRFVSLFVKV